MISKKIEMKLEDALKLKEGTVLRATQSWGTPGKVTKEKEYVMLRGVVPFKRIGEDKPYNASLPIQDDRATWELGFVFLIFCPDGPSQ